MDKSDKIASWFLGFVILFGILYAFMLDIKEQEREEREGINLKKYYNLEIVELQRDLRCNLHYAVVKRGDSIGAVELTQKVYNNSKVGGRLLVPKGIFDLTYEGSYKLSDCYYNNNSINSDDDDRSIDYGGSGNSSRMGRYRGYRSY